MTAAAIIDRAHADGATLFVDNAGKLKVRGNEAAVARWLPHVREYKTELVSLLSNAETEKNLERPGHPSAKTDNTPRGASFGSFGTTTTGPIQNFTGAEPDSEPCRLWLIRHADGRYVSHSFTPPATLAEVRAWYPDAITTEPDTSNPQPVPNGEPK